MNKISKTKKQNKEISSFKFTLVHWIVTFFRVGDIPVAPGTCGSLATLPFWVGVNMLIGFLGFNGNGSVVMSIWIFIIIVLFLIGLKASKIYIETNNGSHDPSEIVIDEVVGQLIALILTPLLFTVLFIYGNEDRFYFTMMCSSCQFMFTFIVLIIPFIFFRLYDIEKPWLVGWADTKVPGVLGVMLDDVIAGVFAAIATIPFMWMYHLALLS